MVKSSDLLITAYHEKRVFIEYYNSTVLKMEYCNGEAIYLFENSKVSYLLNTNGYDNWNVFCF